MGLISSLATGNHERLARGFDHQYRHDRLGVRLHLFFGLCWCFFLGWPVTWIEFAAAPLYLYGALRLTNTWRIALVQLTRPLVLLVLIWSLWCLISLARSPDVANGWNDISKIRFFAAALLLWPVMDSRAWLIAALACGFACGNLVQFADIIGQSLGVEWLDWDRPQDRHSGWWKPAVAGSLMVGVLGLHLPAAFMGRGRTRWIGVGGALLTAIGLVATGTRGAWIAGAALVAVTGGVGVARAFVTRRRTAAAPAHRDRVMAGWVIALALLAAAAFVGWRTVGSSVTRRFEIARDELRAAWKENDYSSFTGQRLLMWELAAEAFAEHPLMGVGTGGFDVWTGARRRESPRPESAEARQRRFPHAHNTFLHEAATTGLPGVLLLALIAWTAIRGALHREQIGRDGFGSYAAGPGFAMIGLLLIGAFDSLQVNAATTALLSTLFVMSLRPPPRTPGWAVDGSVRPGGSEAA